MAEFVLLNCYINLDGQDLSDHITNLNFSVSRDMPEFTSFSNTYRRFMPGLKDLDFSVEANADYDTNEVDDVIWGNWDAGSSLAAAVRPDAGAIAAGNPEYQLTVYVESATILSGNVGDAAKYKTQLKNAAGTVDRDITP